MFSGKRFITFYHFIIVCDLVNSRSWYTDIFYKIVTCFGTRL